MEKYIIENARKSLVGSIYSTAPPTSTVGESIGEKDQGDVVDQIFSSKENTEKNKVPNPQRGFSFLIKYILIEMYQHTFLLYNSLIYIDVSS